MNLLTWNYIYRNCKEQDDEEVRIAKTKKAAKSFYKSIYMSCVVTWGYLVLNDTSYLPKMLLGKGDVDNLNDNYPVH